MARCRKVVGTRKKHSSSISSVKLPAAILAGSLSCPSRRVIGCSASLIFLAGLAAPDATSRWDHAVSGDYRVQSVCAGRQAFDLAFQRCGIAPTSALVCETYPSLRRVANALYSWLSMWCAISVEYWSWTLRRSERHGIAGGLSIDKAGTGLAEQE